MDLNNLNKRPFRVSTGLGTTSCSFHYPNSQELIYSGTFHLDKIQWNSTDFKEFDTCSMPLCRNKTALKDPLLREICKKKFYYRK